MGKNKRKKFCVSKQRTNKVSNSLSVNKQIDEIIDVIVNSPIQRIIDALFADNEEESNTDYRDDVCVFRAFLSEVVACDKKLLEEFHEKRFDPQMTTMYHLITLLVAMVNVQTIEELRDGEHLIAILVSMLETNPFHDYCVFCIKGFFKTLKDNRGLSPQYLKFE